jgi:arylformamidase
MDQRELDDAYDQAVYAPNREQVLGRYEVNSDEARRALGPPYHDQYGPSEAEQLDVYLSDWRGAPINVFLHGGGWRGGRAASYALLGEIFVRNGAHVVIPDFAPIGDHDGDLRPMVEQVTRAVTWVHRNAARFRGDPDRIYLSGHSSGAHLGGCLVTTDWAAEGLPPDPLKGALLVSGMYDLKPVRLSKRSEYVRFTDEIEEALSPIRHLDRLATPLIVAYGTYETPEFQRQSREFAAAVEAAGKPVSLLVAEGYNHFEILETLPSPYGLLGRAVLAQMGLGPD